MSKKLFLALIAFLATFLSPSIVHASHSQESLTPLEFLPGQEKIIAQWELPISSDANGNLVVTLPDGQILPVASSNTSSLGEDWTATIGLGNLSANWSQTAGYDIILANTSSELKILGSDGTYYATIDVGSLGADTTYTFAGSTGTLLTSANYTTYITNSVTSINSLTGAVSVAAGGINAVGTSGSTITLTGTEADTLSAVTGRGATTSTAVTLSSSSNTITAGTLTATGGTIDGTSIGSSTPGLGTFTTFTASGTTIVGSGAGNATSIGNSTGTVQIDSTGLDVSTLGALSGITGYTQSSGNFAISGTGTLSTGTGSISLNGDTTIAADKGLTLSSGTGVITQNYSNTTGSTHILNITNSASSGTNTVRGLNFNLTGTANAGGSNTITAINFADVTATTNNSYDALTLGTGWNNILSSSTVDITAAGVISGLTGLTMASGNVDLSNSSGTFQSGSGSITLNGNTTIASGKTLAVTSADGITAGGTILPQTLFIPVNLSATLLDTTVFVADASYKVTSTRCIYSVAALASGTLMVSVETSTQAPGAGTDQLTGTIDLSGTVNTVQNGTIIGSPTTIAAGDRVSIDVGGTLTNLFGHCTIGLKRV